MVFKFSDKVPIQVSLSFFAFSSFDYSAFGETSKGNAEGLPLGLARHAFEGEALPLWVKMVSERHRLKDTARSRFKLSGLRERRRRSGEVLGTVLKQNFFNRGRWQQQALTTSQKRAQKSRGKCTGRAGKSVV